MLLRGQDIWHSYRIQENSMQVILLETFNKLGKAGEIVNVKDGYANNFLLPQKKAIIANKKNKENLESKMSQINENNEKKVKEANEIKSKLENKTISMQMECNENGNLYGNVSIRAVTDKINMDFSVNLSPENIILSNIKTIGKHEINIRLYDNILASIIIDVLKKLISFSQYFNYLKCFSIRSITFKNINNLKYLLISF